jgi:tetratricopeptide (TPR) repeat protein
METIKVFLASSEELDYFRVSIGNLVRRLDDLYERVGIRVKLFEWEDYDAAYNDRRKQEEYNDHVRRSDLFIALFFRLANRFTLEEFDAALEEYGKRKFPKIYVYFQDLEEESASDELMAFQSRFSNEMGYPMCYYNNRESLQFQFVMQFQHLASCGKNELKVEDGTVTFLGLPIAKMENLRFASANEDYVWMREELSALQVKLEKARLRLHDHPDDEDLVEDLQGKLDKRNDLREKFEEHQRLLFQAAKRVAKLQGEVVTERMRRAVNALGEGRVREAIAILDDAEESAISNLKEYRSSEEIMEQTRQNVFYSIEELLLKASSVMADASVTIEERIERAEKIYSQADEMAQECEYDKEKYIDLLIDYEEFLEKYAYYDKSLKLLQKLIPICEETYGHEHPSTAISYNNLGMIYVDKGDYDMALKYYVEAIHIKENVLGLGHPDTATTYNNLGYVYNRKGNYDKALDFHFKALAIREKTFGLKHPSTAIVYNNIGVVYTEKGEYDKALEYHFKTLDIRENVLGHEHHSTATSYNNLGYVYRKMKDNDKALKYHFIALDIREKVLGLKHPDTATSYNNIGFAYNEKGNSKLALKYHFKALAIREEVQGCEHPDTAISYCNIGFAYNKEENYMKGLEYLFKALYIREKVLGHEHIETITLYHNIADAYMKLGDMSKSQEYLDKVKC